MKSLKGHSLSIVLLSGFLISTFISYRLTVPGTWLYDYMLMVTGSFGGGALFVVCAKYFWERDSDPAKPPIR